MRPEPPLFGGRDRRRQLVGIFHEGKKKGDVETLTVLRIVHRDCARLHQDRAKKIGSWQRATPAADLDLYDFAPLKCLTPSGYLNCVEGWHGHAPLHRVESIGRQDINIDVASPETMPVPEARNIDHLVPEFD
ncbi:MAG TPA: hypothetical protein VIP07_05280 [Candidatus Limnocylindria bacterium]|jgi:hypothetical protein